MSLKSTEVKYLIRILKAPLISIQDRGRYGYQKYGVPTSGYVDEYSAILTNYLAGNNTDTPLLEFAFGNVELKFLEPAVFAVGADAEIRLNDESIEPWKTHKAKNGDVLRIGELRSGMYGYISFRGGLRCKKILGSCSTYPRAGFGRYLREGDILELEHNQHSSISNILPVELIPRYNEKTTVRVVLGPQEEHFAPEGIETFLSSEYEVTKDSDRMGYRLEGEKIKHSEKGADILTDAVPLGSVQVPAHGNPIVMLADRQTTGGYAKIGVVIRSDVWKVAQTPIGGKIRFVKVSIKEARDIWLRTWNILKNVKRYFEGKVRGFRVRVGEDEFLAFVEEIV